jgi:hypothetical protein
MQRNCHCTVFWRHCNSSPCMNQSLSLFCERWHHYCTFLFCLKFKLQFLAMRYSSETPTKQTWNFSIQRKHRNICPLLLKNSTFRDLFKFFFLIRTLYKVLVCHLCVFTVTVHKTKPLILIKQTVYTTVHSKEQNLYKLSKQYFCIEHNSCSFIHSKLE